METSVQTKKNLVRDLSTLSFGEPLPTEVVEFCRTHNITSWVNQSIALVRQIFGVDPEKLYLSRDPETAEEWVVILVKIAKPVLEASDIYERYIREWVRLVTEPSARARIILSYFVE